MIDELRPYPAYKDSNVRWLASVPSHWSILPGKACFNEIYRSNKGMVESTVLSLSFGKIVVKPKEKLHGLVPESFETYQVIEPGDIIIRPTDLQNDWNSLRTSISPHRGIITSAYIALHRRGQMESDFCDRMLRTYDLLKVFYGLGCGLRQNLSWADFKCLPCVLPPPDEQAAIVKFLDYANAKIERAIRAKRKLIGLLNEQKQAIIHRAVTRGLDPNVKLKPSGIPWLGDVPEHWECWPLKFLCHRVQNGATPPSSEQHYFENGSVPWFGPSSVGAGPELGAPVRHLNKAAFTDGKARLINGPAILVIVIGATAGKMGLLIGKGATNQQITSFELKENRLVPLFVVQQLRSSEMWLKSTASTATIPILDSDIVNRLPVAFPTRKEQESILFSVSQQTEPITTAITRYEREINLLREYRTILTAEVVTGKLDVREAAKRLPDEAVETLPPDDSMDEMIEDEIDQEDDA